MIRSFFFLFWAFRNFPFPFEFETGLTPKDFAGKSLKNDGGGFVMNGKMGGKTGFTYHHSLTNLLKIFLGKGAVDHSRAGTALRLFRLIPALPTLDFVFSLLCREGPHCLLLPRFMPIQFSCKMVGLFFEHDRRRENPELVGDSQKKVGQPNAASRCCFVFGSACGAFFFPRRCVLFFFLVEMTLEIFVYPISQKTQFQTRQKCHSSKEGLGGFWPR